MCEKHNIPAIAKSPNVKDGDNCSVQSEISSYAVTMPQAHAWNREGLLSHLCEWIVLDNQVHYLSLYSYLTYSYVFQLFSVIEKESFKALLRYQQPSMVPCDLPSRTTVADEIFTKSLHVKGLITKKFKVLNSLVSFTFDAGTS
jgi:hypothetical protein